MFSHSPVEDARFSECLEYLRQQVAAASVRLLRGPEDGCCGPGRGLAEGADGVTYATSPGCPHLQAGRAEVLVGLAEEASQTDLLFCTISPAPSGRVLALQLGFPGDSQKDLRDALRLARLCRPLLMWAKYALEGQELRERFQAAHQEFTRAQEEEREWLAYEVHDRLGQTLVSAFQQLQAVEALARSFPDIRQVAVRGSVLLREAIREARAIMNELRPPLIGEMGLAPLVEEEVRRLGAEQGWRAQVTVDCAARLSREVEVVLYRILHEALTNIRRHARAKEVAVSLAYHDEVVHLQVKDNGVGFDVGSALSGARVGGLMSMKRRADFAGGTCWIESERGKGTTIDVSIPPERGGLT